MESFDDIRIRDLIFFDRLAVLTSITAVAAEMQVPKATASRWLSRLEESVGQSLVRRTSRSVALTERGKAFALHTREILSRVRATKLAVLAEAPRGTLRVSVPVPMGRMLAGPVIAEFRRRLPDVRLEIKLQNDRVDLIRDDFDVAIRGGALPDSELIAKKLASASMWLYASPRYASDDISSVPLIAAPGDENLLRRTPVGAQLRAASVVVDDRTAVADALVWGAGVGLLPSFLGEPPRKIGELDRLDEEVVAALPVHAIYHPSQRDDPRVQVLIEEMSRQLDNVL